MKVKLYEGREVEVMVEVKHCERGEEEASLGKRSSQLSNARGQRLVPEEVTALKGREKIFSNQFQLYSWFSYSLQSKDHAVSFNTCLSLITWCGRWKHQLRPWYCEKQGNLYRSFGKASPAMYSGISVVLAVLHLIILTIIRRNWIFWPQYKSQISTRKCPTFSPKIPSLCDKIHKNGRSSFPFHRINLVQKIKCH